MLNSLWHSIGLLCEKEFRGFIERCLRDNVTKFSYEKAKNH